MASSLPFELPLQYLFITYFSTNSKYSPIRMKVFLLLCFTHLFHNIQSTVSYNYFGVGSRDRKSEFIQKSFVFGAAVVTIFLPKLKAEFLGEAMLILILSFLSNFESFSHLLEIKDKASKFEDSNKGNIILMCNNLVNSYGNVFDVFSYGDIPEAAAYFFCRTIVYSSVIVGLIIQAYLGNWFTEKTRKSITEHNTGHKSDSEEGSSTLMKTCFCLPLIISSALQSQDIYISKCIADRLIFCSLIFPVIVAIKYSWNVKNNAPTPFNPKIPFKKLKDLKEMKGSLFIFQWFGLLLKVSAKYYLNSNGGVSALRGYLRTRFYNNVIESPESISLSSLGHNLCEVCCGDIFCVFSSSALVASTVRYFVSKEMNSKSELRALGFIPLARIFLGCVNLYFEKSQMIRHENFQIITMFLVILFLSYLYTDAWEEAVIDATNDDSSVNGCETQSRHVEKFVFLVLLYPVFSCVSGDITLPKSNMFRKIGTSRKSEVLESLLYFVCQISFFSFTSLLCISACACYSWLVEDDSETNSEQRLQLAREIHFILEIPASFMICKAVLNCRCRIQSRWYVLVAMSSVNIYSVVFSRGIGIVHELYKNWKKFEDVIENMEVLDTQQMKEENNSHCSMCKHVIEKNGRLAKCGHVFHYYCIRNWLDENETANCPHCNTDLESESTKESEEEKPEEYSHDEEVFLKLVEKVWSKMQKYEKKSTFFSETTVDDTELKRDKSSRIDINEIPEELHSY